MKTRISLIFIAFAIIAGLHITIGCGSSSSKKEKLDTPTGGSINIAVDETFSLVTQSAVHTFEGLYQEAHINAYYEPEADAFKRFLNDSVRIIIASRQLNADEKKYFEKIIISPQTTKIAYDALAIIVNKANPDSQLTYPVLEGIMNGKINAWKQVNAKQALGDIKVVFDNPKSSTYRYIKERFNQGKDLASNFYGANSNRELIDYVSKNKNAIGVLGVNWISDEDDSTSQNFLNKILVVSLAPPDTAKGAGKFYQPYQAYIATGVYPLKREIYIISREARAGLGNGFAAFFAGDKGQRIVLKSDLVPATVPVRVVGFR